MKQIILNVEDKELQTLMTILNNLKEGLIHSIDGQAPKKSRPGKYNPKVGKAIDEREKPAGKYASKAAYKSKLGK